MKMLHLRLHPIHCFLSIVLSSFCFLATAQQINPLETEDVSTQRKWVEEKYNAMSLDEKIGQLYMVDVFSANQGAHTERVKKLIEDYHIGGIIFSKGGPMRQAKLTNEYQALSKIPLMISMDAEWGLAMRLDSTFAYPWNMTLGAIEDNSIISKVGYRIGAHAKRLGVHINFAPDIDINTNPKNPIIGNRSFGEDKYTVTEKGIAFMEGMQRAGVLANGKHFPGHGDTDKDSHKTLPTIAFSKERIDSIELYPFKQLIDKNLASVMVAHLNVPALEMQANLPSSLSYSIVTELLKERLGFNGLIFTDALNMKGASDHLGPGDVDLAAFLAGSDVLLIPGDVPKGVAKIKEAYQQQIISEERLAHSVKKILMAKYKVGLNNFQPVDTTNLIEDLHTLEDDLLYEEAIEHALTVVKNDKALLPLTNLEKHKIAYVAMGDDDGSVFYNALKRYTKVDFIKGSKIENLMMNLEPYSTVVVGLHRSNQTPWKAHEFTETEIAWLAEIAMFKKVILAVFTKPYALLDFPSTEKIESVIVSYQNSEVAQDKTAQLIFGAIDGKGVLPVTAHPDFQVNSCIHTVRINRLQYGLPETVGLSSQILNQIDKEAERVIAAQMTPGMQILVARRGKVVYHKAFGKYTYNGNTPVTTESVYDLASLTKILATLPEVMKLYDEGKFRLEDPMGTLLPQLQNTNKGSLKVLDVLTHYARLKAWIPFYVHTLSKTAKQPLENYYRRLPEKGFNLHVADGLYMRDDYQDSIMKIINESDLLSKKSYVYSDLAFYYMKQYVESQYDKPIDQLVNIHYYNSLGANFTTYNPLVRFSKDQIVPTEVDDYFRHQTIQGYVHDMGAAMQGGVGGHAGLFSNANDVAKLMQLFMQKGNYGGKVYFKPETLDTFNQCFYCEENNRRGVGFDKPQLEKEGPTCGCVSMTSFGHTGFTGTYAWADPEQEIVYVFLSNRTYPTANNRKLIAENVRSNIQELIYSAILD